MENSQLRAFADVVHYKTIDQPYSAGPVVFRPGYNPKLLSHFHKDLEVLHVLKGDIYVCVSQDRLHLSPGSALIINANQPHHCQAYGKESCLYNCLLFKPEFLAGSQVLYQKYIRPVIEDANMPYAYLKEGTIQAKRISLIVDRIADIIREQDPARDLEVMGELCFLFSGLYSYTRGAPVEPPEILDKRLPEDKELRDMISFMKNHFPEKIRLDDIAGAAHVGRSKCCRIFSQYTQQTPMAFLNFYRLEISCNMLRDSDDTISSISKSCGFPNQSYYNKMFLKYYHTTPKEYRRRSGRLSKEA